jgi:hypothetical protein
MTHGGRAMLRPQAGGSGLQEDPADADQASPGYALR